MRLARPSEQDRNLLIYKMYLEKWSEISEVEQRPAALFANRRSAGDFHSRELQEAASDWTCSAWSMIREQLPQVMTFSARRISMNDWGGI
jgi:hypothetical protein